MNETAPTPPSDVDEQPRVVRPLDPSRIRRSPYQVRTDEAPDAALVASVATHGLISPITVRADADGEAYELIAGHRRLAAWREARPGEPVPAIVLEAGDMAAEDLLVAENFVRQDLSPIEQALTVKQLRDHGRTVEQTADVVRRSTRWVQRFSAIAGIEDPWRSHLARSRAPYPRCLAVAQLPEGLRVAAWDSFIAVLHDGRKDEAWWRDEERGMPSFTARLRFLDAAQCPFDCGRVCARCPHRSDHAPALWDEDAARTPRCLDPACYDRHAAAAAEARARRERESSSVPPGGAPEKHSGNGSDQTASSPPAEPLGPPGDAASGDVATSSVPPRDHQVSPAHPGPTSGVAESRGGAEPLSDADFGIRMGVVWTVARLLKGDKLEDILPQISTLCDDTVHYHGLCAFVQENAIHRLQRNTAEARAALEDLYRMGMW